MIQRISPPEHINSIEWSQATGYARQICAQVFRDWGAPRDALKSHNITSNVDAADWGKAVELIAQSMCTHETKSTRSALSTESILKKAA